jgi:hypothetical protein
MKKARATIPWTEANQSYLVAEFSRFKDLLTAKSDTNAVGMIEKARIALKTPAAIDQLAQLFELSPFERDIVVLCAGVEMDSKLATLCGEAQGHAARPFATFGLATAMLPEPHWSALAPSRPLRRYRLVEVEGTHGLTAAPLRIDERILHYLAGVNVLDSRLQPMLHVLPIPKWMAERHREIAAHGLRVLDANPKFPAVVHLFGDDSDAQEDIATTIAHEKGLRLFAVDAADLPPIGGDLNQFVTLWEREAMLLPGALLLRCPLGALSPAARHLAERTAGPLFLASRETIPLNRPMVRYDVDKPPPVEQKRAWQEALGATAGKFDSTVDTLSEQFRLSARAIFSSGAQAASEQNPLAPEELWNLCRSLARPRLEDLAQRISPIAVWDDLVLPPAQKQLLRQMAAQVRHRLQVYEKWGFASKGQRGLGVSALFAGGSGTGKTMAAEVLAGELRLDLYRIDLSGVVSKYIGETEKNLRQVFDAAEEGGVLLLFDEADALFGKRAEVKDSHDRYANIEVGYLLQRMEAYRGLAVLTTNMKAALDKAFQRRLSFSIHFPFPDVAQREAIWSRIFPAQTPTHGLDPKLLARLNVAGGNIRNIALNAAFMAAADEQPVEMKHLLEAARLEAEKIERPLIDAEVRGWV